MSNLATSTDPEEVFIRSEEAYENGYKGGGHSWTNHPLPELTLKFVEQLKKMGNHPKVLDLGCGLGQKSEVLAGQMGLRVVGIDYSQAAIDQAGERTKGVYGDSLEFRQGDVRKIGEIFSENEFDGIFDYQCLASIPRQYWPEVIEGLYKIIKPGGYLLEDFLNRASKEFHGNISHILSDSHEYIFEPDPNNSHHQGLEWEKGLYVYFVDSEEIEQDFGKYFTKLDSNDRSHPKEERVLTSVLMQSRK